MVAACRLAVVCFPLGQFRVCSSSTKKTATYLKGATKVVWLCPRSPPRHSRNPFWVVPSKPLVDLLEVAVTSSRNLPLFDLFAVSCFWAPFLQLRNPPRTPRLPRLTQPGRSIAGLGSGSGAGGGPGPPPGSADGIAKVATSTRPWVRPTKYWYSFVPTSSFLSARLLPCRYRI